MTQKTIGFRPTERGTKIIEQWLRDHKGPDGEDLTPSDALRDALNALEIVERERQAQRDRRAARSRSQ
jgi:hypothetical protein